LSFGIEAAPLPRERFTPISNEAANLRSEQEKFDRAINIAEEVVKRAKAGNKTCMSILRKAGALRG